MRLPPARTGDEVTSRDKALPFTFWPTRKETTREKVQHTLFATDPWYIIQDRLNGISSLPARRQAGAFLKQAREFYESARVADINISRPLLLYYSFLNLVKSFIVFRAEAPITVRLSHGLQEQLPTTAGAVHGQLVVKYSLPNGVFKRFSDALGQQINGVVPVTDIAVRSSDFLAQILIGHRVYCAGEGILERFISVDSIRYWHDVNQRTAWLTCRFDRSDATRFGYSGTQVGAALNRASTWRRVVSIDDEESKKFLVFETIVTHPYAGRPADVIGDVSLSGKFSFWRSVTSYPPYRKYYAYLSTPTQVVFHQLLSIYMAVYYFGSITRYKPEELEFIMNSRLGPFVNEFFSNQASQFLYLMASEMVEQEVTKAAIV